MSIAEVCRELPSETRELQLVVQSQGMYQVQASYKENKWDEAE